MTIKVKCKTCLKELEVPDSFAGRQGKCPFCGEIIDVPSETADDEIRIEGDEPSAPPQEPREQPIQQTAPGPKLGLPGKSKKPLRLSVIIAGGAAIVVALVLTFIINQQLTQPMPEEQIDLSDYKKADATDHEEAAPPSEAAETPAEKTAQPAPQPARVLQATMGLPPETDQYLMVKNPRQILADYAAMPIWKDQADAKRRATQLYDMFVQRLSAELGMGRSVADHLLSISEGVHIGRPQNGSPILIAEQERPATRDSIFGNFEAVDYRQTEKLGDAAIDVFGEGDTRFYMAYHKQFAVMGKSLEPVKAALDRLADDSARSFADNDELAQNLTDSNLSLRFFAPGAGIDPQVPFLQGLRVKRLAVEAETGRLYISSATGNDALAPFASGESKDITLLVRQRMPRAAIQLSDNANYAVTVTAEKTGEYDIAAGPEFAALTIARLTAPAEKKASPQVNAVQAQAQCKEQMEAVGDAVAKFVGADLDTFQYPRGVNELLEAELLLPEDLICPTEENPSQIHGVVSSYELLFDRVAFRLEGGFSTTAIIAWERNPNHNGKHSAIFVDGKVKLLTDAELQRAIEAALSEAKEHAPRKVNIPTR